MRFCSLHESRSDLWRIHYTRHRLAMDFLDHCDCGTISNSSSPASLQVTSFQYAVFSIVHAILCRETYAPVLLARKTTKLQKETGNMDLRSKMDDGLTKRKRIQRAIIRPIKMLLFSSIVALMAVYCALVYGILYLLYTTYTFVFQEIYGFSTGTVGLVYIGSGVGMLIGLFIIGGSSDKLLKAKAKKHGGELKPEYRLLPLMATCWLPPVGLFIYGWTVEYHKQWAIPLFGTLLFGIGIIAVLICVQVICTSLRKHWAIPLTRVAIPHRCLHHLRRFCSGCQHSATVNRRRRTSTRGAQHVRDARFWLGK